MATGKSENGSRGGGWREKSERLDAVVLPYILLAYIFNP